MGGAKAAGARMKRRLNGSSGGELWIVRVAH
jgi:hypothetical protein